MTAINPDLNMAAYRQEIHVGPPLDEATLHRARLTIAAHAPKEDARKFIDMLGLGVAS